MMAKVIWKMKKTLSGMVGARMLAVWGYMPDHREGRTSETAVEACRLLLNVDRVKLKHHCARVAPTIQKRE